MNVWERCDEVEVENEEEPKLASNEEAFPDDGDRLVCVLHRVYLAPKNPENSLRHNLFRTRGP